MSGSKFSFFHQAETVVKEHPEIRFQRIKQRVHEQVVASLDIASAEGLSNEELSVELQPFVREILEEEKIDLETPQIQRLMDELPFEMFGVGPLESLLRDKSISDILVNHAHEVFIERDGKIESTDVVFANNKHLMQVIQRLVGHVGRRIDESSPLVDARMEDGSRINAVIPPLSLDGPKLSIRRFGNFHSNLENLIANDSLTRSMAEFLTAAVRARKSILISGGTGSGKTTMLNALSSCIPDNERIITIEDSAELLLQHRHVARLETRPANSENTGEFNQRDLVRNSLRMRPDRIIVGEVRGAEALDMLQAMNTGHEGSLTTIHANDTRDAIERLEMMVAMAGLDLPNSVVRSYICSGISILVHLARLPGGVRKVMRIAELRKLNDGYDLTDIFSFQRTGIDDQGCSKGNFKVKNKPRCVDDFPELGISIDESIFGPANESITSE